MAQWVCNRCTCRFAVGSRACPHPECLARDAHEDGGDTTVNVYQLDVWREVDERLGLHSGDQGAPDASTDPEPVGVPKTKKTSSTSSNVSS